jgi:TonB-linked SusC/RagA family outer membrane protein
MKKQILFFFLALFSQLIYAQNSWQVSGVVTDTDDGLPLPGVTVSVQGLLQGTITDLDGKFSLDVPKGKSVVLSYIGYKTQTVIIRGNDVLNIAMEVDSHLLDEVVAIGYGTMKKSDLTGAIGSVSGEKLRAAPVARVDQALQGRIAGVTVNSNSGQPGADAAIRIRGVGTLNDSDPIYVVDGLITDNIRFLSTSDIASLEVLKDASAQAIYGSRGANGVILITTKKGDATGKTNLTFESYFGIQNRWKKLDVMRRDEFTATRARFDNTTKELDENGLNEWIRSNYTPNTDTYYPRILSETTDPNGMDYTLIDTDWQDEVFVKNATMQNYYFSADGGNDKSNYMASVNYFDQNGTLIGSYYKRLTLRVNTSFKVRDWLRIGENLSFSNSHDRNIQGNGNTALIASALSMAPWDPVTYPEGTYANYGRRQTVADAKDLSGQYAVPSLFRNVMHPYNQVYNSKPDNNNDDWVGDIYVEILPVKGLILRGDVSMKLWNGMERTFTPTLDVIYNSIMRNGVSASMMRSQQLTYEGTATYNTIINRKHDITLMLGATAEENNYYRVNASGSELVNTDEKNWYVGKTPDAVLYDEATKNYYSTRSGSDEVDKGRMMSYLGRLQYSFDNKYLLTSSIRIDGSSYLTSGNYWDVFPSVAGAWKISEEGFFEPLKEKIDFMKVRAGWGQIGNVNSLVMNSADANVETGTAWMVGNPFGTPNYAAYGMSSTGIPPKIVWERTEQLDLGVDISLLRSLLYCNIDFFRRDTRDMHMGIIPPGHIGYRFPPQGNAATVRNQGIEFSLEHKYKIGDFSYSVAGNFSFIKNKLTALNDGEVLWDGIIMNNEGYALNTIYTLVYDGVFQNQEEIDAHAWTNSETGQIQLIQPEVKPGDARYLDLNNDGQITDLDRTNAGNPFPTTTYGFNASFNYKGFDFQVFFQGIGGNEVYNYLNQNKLEGDGTASVLSASMKNVFLPGADPADPARIINLLPGSNGSIPNPTPTGNTHNKDASSRFVEDASYLRLKNLQLGYTIPKMLTSKIGIERLRFYVGGSNLLTFTKYKGFDPEVGNNGRDWGNFPQARTLLFGINMNF